MDALEYDFDAGAARCNASPQRHNARALDMVVRKGETLYRAGDACRRLFLLREGVVRVQAVSRTGREIVLYRVRPGEICMMTAASLMSGMAYRADAIVETDARMHVLSATEFEERLGDDPIFRKFVLSSLARRMHGVVHLLQDIAFEGVGGRLAALLVARIDGDGMVHDTHEALALELGSAREVISRRLKDFEQKGWVELGRGSLRVTDAASLERLLD